MKNEELKKQMTELVEELKFQPPHSRDFSHELGGRYEKCKKYFLFLHIKGNGTRKGGTVYGDLYFL